MFKKKLLCKKINLEILKFGNWDEWLPASLTLHRKNQVNFQKSVSGKYKGHTLSQKE